MTTCRFDIMPTGNNSATGISISVESMIDGNHVMCPRCWHWHGVAENFGHTPEEIAADKSLEKEKLCDRCQRIILTDYPSHPSVPHIKSALAKWLRKDVK
jgi:hypothetical protein